MLKAVGIAGIGLVAGLALATLLPGPGPEPGAPSAFLDPVPRAERADERVLRLEEELRSEAQQRLVLEARVDELAAALQSLRASAAQRAPAAGVATPSAEALAAMREGAARAERNATEQRAFVWQQPALENARVGGTQREVERLVAGGFQRARAEFIERRMDELQVAAMEAQFAAQQSGQPAAGVATMEQMLRRELGDAEYEQLRRAQGRSTQVSLVDVFASSAAERAGFRPGDQILAYGGTRVFEPGDLNQLTMQGAGAATVVVDVIRDGQRMQLVVPRGPLGVSVTGG